MKKEKIAWIDNTKMTACVLIMLAHFQNAAIDFCLAPPASSPVFDVLSTMTLPLRTGKMWVMIFCIVSGYLGSKRIESFKELCVESGFRYLRFLIPMFLCNLFVLLLSRMGLFFHQIYGTMYDSQWLMACYPVPYRLRNLLRDTILLDSAPGSPTWTIRLLFLGNLMILGVNYVTQRMTLKQKLAVEVLILTALLVLSRRFLSLLYVSAVFSGLIFADTKRTVLSPKLIPLLVVPAFAMYYLPFSWVNTLPHFLATGLVYTFCFFCSGYKGKGITAVNFSSMSFWVYVLHWPTICSLGIWLLLHLPLPFWIAYGISAVLTGTAVLGLSVLLSKTFDVWLNRRLKQSKQKLLSL